MTAYGVVVYVTVKSAGVNEPAVGQTITSAKVSKKKPLVVQLRLADGSTVELLKQPGSPAPGPVARTRRSVRGGESE